MLMKLICSAVSSNQSHGEYPECRSEREAVGEPSLLVSPLVVAGIVIGLVLFLSCITIIVGSLRKDSGLRNNHLGASYGHDGFSFGGSVGELRSTCLEEFPPGLEFPSYGDTLSQINGLYSDSPPRYEECVGPGATEIYIPLDDPPPYSLLDPFQEATGHSGEEPNNPPHPSHPSHTSSSHTSGTDSPASTSWFSGRHVSSISYPLEEAPPYESVLLDSGQPLPLAPMPCEFHKHPQSRGEGRNSRRAEASQIR